MSDDLLKYDQMVEDALRGVVRSTLSEVAERGLPGNHQLYLTFLTDHPGVEIADHLRERYPGDMTIVLQYQFWGLEVESDAFAVSLSFDDMRERLYIPFDAITSFADPSVNFALQFNDKQSDGDIEDGDKKPALSSATQKRSAIKLAPSDEPAPPSATADDNVVTLEKFRKK